MAPITTEYITTTKDNKSVCIFLKTYWDKVYLHHKVLSMQSLAVVAMVTTQKYAFALQESNLSIRRSDTDLE